MYKYYVNFTYKTKVTSYVIILCKLDNMTKSLIMYKYYVNQTSVWLWETSVRLIEQKFVNKLCKPNTCLQKRRLALVCAPAKSLEAVEFAAICINKCSLF